MATLAINQLPSAPLGAGDLIDRAVRLYRQQFLTLIRITAPPVVVFAIGSVLWTIGVHRLMLTPSGIALLLYIALAGAGLLLLLGGNVLNLVVMGGATRNLITHLLWNEPVTARTTYRNVRARFWGLLGAALVISLCLAFAGGVAFIGWYMVIAFVFVGAFALGSFTSVWVSALLGVIGFLAATTLALFLFFFLAGQLAYVPQVMMVEGKGVFAAISRSCTLARGNVRRLMAMTLFITFVTYSALMILLIPLGLYGYLNGIDPSPWNQANWPSWYAIGYNVLWQSSSILITPVWMLGLSLLYVDERVRHEGYDIELLAARQLGPMPVVTAGSFLPLAPAIVTQSYPGAKHTDRWPSSSVLGLN
jgi:hypothetical protein